MKLSLQRKSKASPLRCHDSQRSTECSLDDLLLTASSFVCLVQLSLEVGGRSRAGGLSILILLLKVLVVEVLIDELLVVEPGAGLVGVLLVVVAGGWSTIDENVLAVVADVVSRESIVAPKNHLSPKVGVLAGLVHRCIWLEVFLNEELIFVNHLLDVLLSGVWVVVDLVEVPTHRILLFMELLEVNSLDSVDVVGDESTQYALVQAGDPLLLS